MRLNLGYAIDMIQVAIDQLGYQEKQTNDQLYEKEANSGTMNFTKFAYEMDTFYSSWYDEKRQGKDWDGLFVNYCFIKAFGIMGAYSSLFLKPRNQAYDLEYAVNIYKKNGRFDQIPKLGDQVFFVNVDNGKLDHTGIVSKVNDNDIQVIEGDRGDVVVETRYDYDKSNIYGFGHPLFDEVVINMAKAKAIRLHFSPKFYYWDLDEDSSQGPIRHNILDITAAGSISEVSSGSGDSETTSIEYNPANGPVLIVIKENAIEQEVVDWIEDSLPDLIPLIIKILSDPIAYDKKLHPGLYEPIYHPGPPDEDGNDSGGYYEEITTLQTPLITLLIDGINKTFSMTITGYKADGTDTEKDITYIEYITGTGMGCELILLMPAFSYTVDLMDKDEQTWEVFLFNTPGLGILQGAIRLYDKYQNMYGKTEDFQGASLVEELWLANSAIEGDIAGFGLCSSLRKLYLGYTDVFGSIVSLSGTSLEILSIFNTAVCCDLKELDTLPSLYWFNVNNTSVYGDLEGISTLTKLKVFDVSDTDIDGNISALSNLTNLEEIWLNQEAIHGDIGSLSKLTQLKKIHLNKMNIYGDIGVFGNMTGLTNIELESLSVTGDIRVTESLYDLQVLKISKCPVGGTMPVLHDITITTEETDSEGNSKTKTTTIARNIKQLHFENTNIEGDISNLPNRAQELTLIGSNFYGDISALSGFSSLEEVCLTDINVIGDIKALQGKPLVKIEIHDVKLTGYIGSLSGISTLKHLSISQTKVGGSLTVLSQINDSLTGLSNLILFWVYSCPVTGDIKALSAFTQLKDIRINDTKIFGYYSSLKNLTELSSLITFGSLIQGDPQDLSHLHLAVFNYGDSNIQQAFI